MMISTKTTWSEVLEVAGKRWRSERDQMEWKIKYNKNKNRYIRVKIYIRIFKIFKTVFIQHQH